MALHQLGHLTTLKVEGAMRLRAPEAVNILTALAENENQELRQCVGLSEPRKKMSIATLRVLRVDMTARDRILIALKWVEAGSLCPRRLLREFLVSVLNLKQIPYYSDPVGANRPISD
jgi:hypothetical protein